MVCGACDVHGGGYSLRLEPDECEPLGGDNREPFDIGYFEGSGCWSRMNVY